MAKLRFTAMLTLLTELLMVPILVSAFQSSRTEASGNNTLIFQKGMSYTTYANLTPDVYSSAESDESLRHMKQIGVEWVAINVVGWYQTNETSADIHKNPNQAPTNKALTYVIQTARNLGMKVMLKPMIDLENGEWRGKIQPSKKWFEDYTSYINFFAEFAKQQGAEMFCVGTELTQTVSWETEWRNIISGVRQRYSGLLTYAAIYWKEYDEFVQWWDALDYVGIDAYFPLSSKNDPTISEMLATWKEITNYLDSWYLRVKKPIIFTEIGYLSTDGTNKDPSNYKLQNDTSRTTDLQEQADCYEATFQAVWRKSWFYGMYWWYWQTNPNATIAFLDRSYNQTLRDYTPQNKPAQGVITHWYPLNWQSDVSVRDYTPYIISGISLVTIIEAILIVVLWRKRKSMPKSIPKG